MPVWGAKAIPHPNEEWTLTWTRITDPDQATRLLPAWFGSRMIGSRGTFGLLLATGDVMRITSVVAVHHASDGTMMLDVLLDGAGVPDGVDLAWRAKHYLGAPVPGATLASVNARHVVAAVEFVAAEIAESPDDAAVLTGDEIMLDTEERAPDAVARIEA